MTTPFKKKLLAIAIGSVIATFLHTSSFAVNNVQYSTNNNQWFANAANEAGVGPAILTSDNGAYLLSFSHGYFGIYDNLGNVIWGMNMQGKASFLGITEEGLGLWDKTQTSAVFLAKSPSLTNPDADPSDAARLRLNNDGNLVYETLQNNVWTLAWQSNTAMSSTLTSKLVDLQNQKIKYQALEEESSKAQSNLNSTQQALNQAIINNDSAIKTDLSAQQDALTKVRAHNKVITDNAFQIAAASLKRMSALPNTNGATPPPPTITSTVVGSNTKKSKNYSPPLPKAQQDAINCNPGKGIGAGVQTNQSNNGVNMAVSAGIGGSANATVTGKSIDVEVSFRACTDAVVSTQGQLIGPGGAALAASVTLETFSGLMVDASLEANKYGMQASALAQDGLFITITADTSTDIQGFGIEATGQVVVISGNRGEVNLQANKNGVAVGADGVYGNGVQASANLTQNMRYGSATAGAGASVGVVGAGGSAAATTNNGVLTIEVTGDLAAGVGIELDANIGINYGKSYNDMRTAYNFVRKAREGKIATRKAVEAAQISYKNASAASEKALTALKDADKALNSSTSYATNLLKSEVSKNSAKFAKVVIDNFENPTAIANAVKDAANQTTEAVTDAANHTGRAITNTTKSAKKSIKKAFRW